MTTPATRPHTTPFATVDLDELGRLVGPGGHPVPSAKVRARLARTLRVPDWATDIYVYVHGWQTGPAAALRRAEELFALVHAQHARHGEHYPRLQAFRPWGVVVRWPSSSLPTLAGYRRIRDRAHAMSANDTGHAPHVLAHLLGYLDGERSKPGPDLLKTRRGQFLHLVGHSFGGRFLCEAVSRAARPRGPAVAGWGAPGPARHPFTVDSMVIFQMAAPRDCFTDLFPDLLPAPADAFGPPEPADARPDAPSDAPPDAPSDAPPDTPTGAPGHGPSGAPPDTPTGAPGHGPSGAPPDTPSGAPGHGPSGAPLHAPSGAPMHGAPSGAPRHDAPSGAPMHGPIVLTYSRFDRATGFWHLRAERAAGIGHSGVGVAPVPVSSLRLLPVDTPYRAAMLDHRLVSVDSSWRYNSGRLSPARAHSDFAHPETAHLLLNLADLSR
ncbi:MULTISPECIES: hypothetical protein [unclassified Streptomyces]|uniref:hypothetical protein n=1 Tax=unclassified Streptomyces TaxID=2593676 RepID=UPI00278C6B80|nr:MULTISPECIES: hypothetical protein [unclassified Streptomyces]